MPRYFFDTLCGNYLTSDDDGVVCDTLEQVRLRAVESPPELAFEVLPDTERSMMTVRVRNEAGKPIYEAQLEFCERWPAT